MVAAKTSDDLLDEAKVLAATPPSDTRVTDSEMLEIGAHALSMEIAELFMSAGGTQRWVYTGTDVATVVDQFLYRLPSRALGSGLADLLIIDAGGEEYDAPEIPLEDVWLYAQQRTGNWRSPYAYAFQGDHIHIVPTPTDTSYTLRMRWHRQPARLVAVSAAALVTGVTGTTITCASIPSSIATPLDVDVVEGTPHGDVLQTDAAATIAASVFTIAAGVDAEIAAGDYVCIAGETCIPPIPEAVWPLLVGLVAHEVIDAYGDGDAYARSEKRIHRRRELAKRMLTPRNKGETPKLINRHSSLRGGRFPRWLGRG